MPTTGSHLEDYLTTTLNANREPLEACVHVDDERLGNGGYPQLASEDAIASLWGAACAADASVGAPPLSEVSLPSSEPKRWPEIFAAAVANNDDHVIKMAYTCHRESARYGNPLYQAAAARLVAVGKTE